MAEKCDLFLWRHHILHLLQSFGGKKLIYEFEVLHANNSHVCPIYNTVFWKFWNFWILEHFYQKNCFFLILGVKIQKFWKSETAIL